MGYTAFKLVSYTRSKVENVINSKKQESINRADGKHYFSDEIEGYIENEKLQEEAEKNAPSIPSADEYYTIENENSDETEGKMLDLSSSDAFILSYNNLVDKVGVDVSRESVRSEYYKAAMYISTVGNVEVWSYQLDGTIRKIYIRGKDVTKKVGKYLDENIQVVYENGDTVIDVITVR